jgi:hypothetical protein
MSSLRIKFKGTDAPGMAINPEQCKQAAMAMRTAFSWGDSQEGWDAWNYVYQRLLDLAKKGPANRA